MKIKRKVQKTLPQLIEWAWDNDVRDESFKCKEGNRIKHVINVNSTGRVDLDSDNYYEKNDTFTVEVEEEITEDTELYGLIELGNDGKGDDFFFSRGLSIKDCKDEFTQAFYILNDDLTMTLIWRDGKLVE